MYSNFHPSIRFYHSFLFAFFLIFLLFIYFLLLYILGYSSIMIVTLTQITEESVCLSVLSTKTFHPRFNINCFIIFYTFFYNIKREGR